MITVKQLTPMHCVGYMGYDDEWHSDSRYRKYLKLDNHHYQVQIWKRRKNDWGLQVNLCLTAWNSNDILIATRSAKTMKELKQLAVDEINKYHNTDRCVNDIGRWKETHGKKVFNGEFTYIGISYTSPDWERKNTEFDYYNEKKPKVGYGTYYMLQEHSVMVCNIGYGWSSTTWDNSEELRNKLLERCAG